MSEEKELQQEEQEVVENQEVNEQQAEQPAEQETQQNDNAKLNFEALREAKKKAERERDELLRRIESLENKNKEEVDDSIYDDDEVTVVKKELNNIKKTIEQDKYQQSIRKMEQRLEREFPDLNNVINEKTVEILKARDPEFARVVSRPPADAAEFYNRAISAYTLINKYGIAQSATNSAVNEKKISDNMNKPKTAASAASSKSDALSELSQFADLPPEERRRAIVKLARERAGMI